MATLTEFEVVNIENCIHSINNAHVSMIQNKNGFRIGKKGY